MRAKLTLTPGSLSGCNATKYDYESWSEFVSDLLEHRVGFAVDVDVLPFGSPGEDQYSGTEEQVAAMNDAMVELLNDWRVVEEEKNR